MHLLKSLLLAGSGLAGLAPLAAFAQSGPAQPVTSCPRFAAGSAIVEPVDLFSTGGVLKLGLSYQTRIDEFGNTLFCYMSDTGTQSPTLHIYPGDTVKITFRNDVPVSTSSSMHSMAGMVMSGTAGDSCGAAVVMDNSSTNIHYHGTNLPPSCHQDEVIKTLVNSGQTFEYDLQFPNDEPAGLYWYHPHVHGISEVAVQGGASGAIIVEGIENANPAVAGLPERVLVIRDNNVPGKPDPDSDNDVDLPAWDISLNYIPISWPDYRPAVIAMRPGEKQFWRVVNASADTILDLRVKYDGVTQPLELIALDGVAIGSQNAAPAGKSLTRRHLLIAPAARAEFIIKGPAFGTISASLMTSNVDTGPLGDSDPERPIATILSTPGASDPPVIIPQPTPQTVAPGSTAPSAMAHPRASHPRFAGLSEAAPTATRKLYFSEVVSNPADPSSPTNFFITVDGQTPALFNPNNPPAIQTTQGAVEDWVIENRAEENHEFHIHQIHFLVLSQTGSKDMVGQMLDTINIPYWSGKGPYPSVTVRMDFRGDTVGDFVYHCHILGHEDNGMMAIIRVNPK